MHAHTNLAPNEKQKDWYNKSCTDSMLIARKNYSGNPKYVDLKTYVCTPPNHLLLNSNLVPPQPGLFKRFKKKE